jgi:hypothetical protein
VIVFINRTGTDDGWQAMSVLNVHGIGVYLTEADKGAIAKMDKNTKCILESRPAPTDQRMKWAATVRRAGELYYQRALKKLLGITGTDSEGGNN